MSDDPNEAISGLSALDAPTIDTEGDLRRVHRMARRRTAIVRGAPIAALVIVAATFLVETNRPNALERAGVKVLSGNVAQAAEPPSEAGKAASTLAAFSIDLFKQAASDSPDANTVLSPASIYFTLAMVLLGAKGNTRTQLIKLLHTDETPATLASLNALATTLTAPRKSLGSGTDPDHPAKTLPPRPGAQVSLANSVWIQHGLPVEQPFLNQLSGTFGADAYATDFSARTEASRKAINDWVAKHTDHKITELIARGQLNSLSRMVLANATTFSGRWVTPFSDPTPGTFTTAAGKRVTASMLSTVNATEPSGNAGKGWKSAVIPIIGGAHLVVITPDDPDSWPTFVRSLSANTLAKAAQPELVTNLTMPTFSSATRVDVASALQGLGATDAFNPHKADFGGITRSERLYLGPVQHQARIEVDKNGVEAQAATVAMFFAISAAVGQQHIVLDHPFVYAIMDDTTHAPLFIGQVTDPTQTS